MMSFSLQFILILIGTFLIALVLTPLVRLLSFKIGAVDYPNARRINTKPMPSAGGLSIVIAFSIATLVFIPMLTSNAAPIKSYLSYTLPVVGAGWIIALTGLIDDVKELSAKKKMIGILLAASIVWFLTDFRLNDFKIPFGGPLLHFDPWLSYLLTVIWIISITNAVNLIDGLDGLCGGMSVVIFVVIGCIAIVERRMDITIITFLLAASTFGFLVYNAHPASIFMGDCGSLFLGFMISAISLLGFKSSTIVTLALPMLLLMLPIIDTLSAILRRTLKGRKFLEADKSHIHHLLMKQFGHRNTVIIMCGITTLFGFSAFVYMLNEMFGLLAIMIILLAVEIFIEKSAMISEHFHPILGICRRGLNRIKLITKIIKEHKEKKSAK